MENSLIQRLEEAVAGLLEKNRHLKAECQALKDEKVLLIQEREQLLGEVEKILKRLENLQLEDS